MLICQTATLALEQVYETNEDGRGNEWVWWSGGWRKIRVDCRCEHYRREYVALSIPEFSHQLNSRTTPMDTR